MMVLITASDVTQQVLEAYCADRIYNANNSIEGLIGIKDFVVRLLGKPIEQVREEFAQDINAQLSELAANAETAQDPEDWAVLEAQVKTNGLSMDLVKARLQAELAGSVQPQTARPCKPRV